MYKMLEAAEMHAREIVGQENKANQWGGGGYYDLQSPSGTLTDFHLLRIVRLQPILLSSSE